MNKFHTDNFPRLCRKIMIYVSGAGPEGGTTEFLYEDKSTRWIEGAPGTWSHFKSNEILHRGINAMVEERKIIDITIAPSLENDPRPVTWHGLNAYYPKVPWFPLHNAPSLTQPKVLALG
jgi:hypothetical protein